MAEIRGILSTSLEDGKEGVGLKSRREDSMTQIFWGKGDIHERFGKSRVKATGITPCTSRAGHEWSLEISHPALLQLHPCWKGLDKELIPLRIKGGGFIRSPLPDDSITVRRKQSCLPPQRAAPAPLPAVALSWILSPALGASGSHDSYFPGRPSVGILFEFGVLVCM